MYDITSSIVTYNTNLDELKKVIDSFLNTEMDVHLYISDNSPTNKLEEFIKKLNNPKITYFFNNKNGGYGWGHNRIIEKIIDNSKYHIILNPDIYFEKG
ncbi:MAG: glycosyltransferase, partial [Peptostreptococcaceae bacterium]